MRCAKSTTHDEPFLPEEQGYVICVKGAPDLLLDRSAELLHLGRLAAVDRR